MRGYFLICMFSLFKKYFGPGNRRLVDKLQPLVEEINGFETKLAALTDEQLKAKTQEFKERLAKGETLDNLLTEAFAVVREAGKRVSGMRHYDVQMIGGIVLHRGMIAEMRTGEGKTLVATLPTYLNALEGKGVHVVTVNDYLAKRDAVWMAKIYDFLGMRVGVIQNQRVSFIYDASVVRPLEKEPVISETGETLESELEAFKIEDEFLRPATRQEAYRCDITYGTNNEFGFDYLRDNMVTDLSQMVMRPGHEMNYALVDEVDSILIDEARTPLIISAAAEEATDQYYRFAELVRGLKETDDYNVDEKMHSSTLTEAGITKFEQWLGIANIYEEGGIKIVHHIEQALKAEVLFRRDRDYIVDNGEVIIIDEFTGRKMPGRRYSEGLHQALEAKEKLSIQKESQTLATITFQNLFRMYRKLGGMTGTAATEAEELFKIYHLEVVTIPTNRLDHRTDLGDRIYKLEEGKFAAIAELVKERRANNQPVLIGTISVEKNERLSSFLTAKGIQHEILNAKNHEREGEIIAQAGRPGAVTLATNMAGRGVDIKLGGVPANPQDLETVVKAGGLFVLGTERHESRRIDNQLRGRAARQGDPGETQFFVSTEDELMRIFGGDRLKGVMTRLNVPDDMPIEQKMISRVLENAQKKVEAHHFDTRKNLLEYDDVLNKQRTVIYQKRRAILEAALKTEENILEKILQEYLDHEIEAVVATHTNTVGEGDWDVKEIYETVQTIFPTNEADQKELMDIAAARAADNFGDVEAREKISAYLVIRTREAESNIKKAVHDQFSNNEEAVNLIREVQKGILIRAIDTLWVDHLVAIDYLRSGIGLQGYGQRDPLVEYKRQSFQMFNQLLSDIQKEIVYSYFKVGVGVQLAPSIMDSETIKLSGPSDGASSDQIIEGKVLELNSEGSNEVGSPRVEAGRNEPCPCGLGKKFKKCHGA